MKFCPMCGTVQTKRQVTVCEFCDYEEKDFKLLSKQEIDDIMACYEYEVVGGGVRIKAVKNARNLRGAVAIPHFVTEIGKHAFSSCKFLSRFDLPKNLRYIGDGAFAGCRDLFDVFIPAGVSHIGKGAFSGCYDLGVIEAAASEQPQGWDREWRSGCDAKVEWSSTEEE